MNFSAIHASCAAGKSCRPNVQETSLRALAKLEQVLPSRLRHRVGDLRSVTVPLTDPASAVDPDVLTAIAAAVATGRACGSATAPTTAPRTAAPPSRTGCVDPYRYRGRFTVHAPAEVVAARMPPTMAVVEPVDDGACVLSTGSNSLDEPAAWVARLGVPFEVHEPPELVEHIRALGARLVAAARPRTTES
ncbi:YafY family protein [Microbispora sp. H13382]|uniref:helix-turn-helix transcriptional regulator n=1 Tax=Microbispora sp. H13382 TaxID=2729112 RepID=UPI001C71F708|nr:WYL domain-containing protein [Microbispora sp. H13382]